MASTPPLRSALLETFNHAGEPLATLYLPTASDTEDAEQRLAIHKDNLERALRNCGASDALMQVVADELESIDHADGTAYVIVADQNRAILSTPLTRPVANPRVWVEPVPMLVPLLAATQTDDEHLAVILDRSGADVMLRSGVGDPLDTFEVDGPYKRLHRSAPGGWSQKRFQQTAENAWELNAREVVDEILADHPDTSLIICGGDERAVGFFTQHLPEHVEHVVVAGSRHADADAFLDAADVALRDRAATRQVDLLDNFRTALGNENAVTGGDVLDMLVQGRVSDLLVVDNSMNSTDCATIEFDFAAGTRASSDDGGVQAPLVEAAVARAVATGADVHVVADTADTTDGVAAILRF